MFCSDTEQILILIIMLMICMIRSRDDLQQQLGGCLPSKQFTKAANAFILCINNVHVDPVIMFLIQFHDVFNQVERRSTATAWWMFAQQTVHWGGPVVLQGKALQGKNEDIC